MIQQQTLATSCVMRGISVHNGYESVLTFIPASVNHGIVWRDACDKSHSLRIGTVVPIAASHATVFKVGGWHLSTIEHVMAALWGLCIDNVLIEISQKEAPIFDGSALSILLNLQACGIVAQGAVRSYITPRKELIFTDAKRGGEIRIIPVNEGTSELCLQMFYEGIRRTFIFNAAEREQFFSDIAPARTCGFIEQLPHLRSLGLAQGSTLGNTVVQTIAGEYLNTRRFSDEPVRHKVLDLIGDLFLLPAPLVGSVYAQNTGHSFNHSVIEHYLAHSEEWRLIPE